MPNFRKKSKTHFAAVSAVRSKTGYIWINFIKWSFIHRMCLLIRAVTSNSTNKSIETNLMGAQRNPLTFILSRFPCFGLTTVQISQLEMKLTISSYKPGYKKSSRMRLWVLKIPKWPENRLECAKSRISSGNLKRKTVQIESWCRYFNMSSCISNLFLFLR